MKTVAMVLLAIVVGVACYCVGVRQGSAVQEEQVINYGPLITYDELLQHIDETGSGLVFTGPLEIDEPNTTVANCVFVVLECLHELRSPLILGNDASGCNIIGNMFRSGPLTSPIDPGMALCADNIWHPGKVFKENQ